jgi:hypothetical protein
VDPPRGRLLTVTSILVLTTLGAIAEVVAVGRNASLLTIAICVVAAAAGVGSGWRFRGELQPGGRLSNSWWLVLAVTLGGLLGSMPEAVQMVVISLLGGFLVVCCVVVGRRSVKSPFARD